LGGFPDLFALVFPWEKQLVCDFRRRVFLLALGYTPSNFTVDTTEVPASYYVITAKIDVILYSITRKTLVNLMLRNEDYQVLNNNLEN